MPRPRSRPIKNVQTGPIIKSIPKKKPDLLELNYESQGPKQIEFHKTWRTKTRIASGAFKSGKTILAAFDVLYQMLYNPVFFNSTALIIAVSDDHIKTQLWPVFETLLTNYDEETKVNKGFQLGRHYTLMKSPYILQFNKGINGGPKLVFASALSENSLRGHSHDIVMVDDLASCMDEEVWRIVQSRARRRPRFKGDLRGFVIATCNPDSPSSWIYTNYMHYKEENQPFPKDLYCETFTLFDNESMRSSWESDVAEFAHNPIGYQKYILGKWVSSQGLVYPNFNRAQHVIEDKHNLSKTEWDYNESTKVLKPFWSNSYLSESNIVDCGIDFGTKTAVVWIMTKYVEDNPLPIYIIFHEYFSDSVMVTISRHSQHIKNTGIKVHRFFSDHYSETIASYRENGINCTKADKTPGAEILGRDLISRLLFENRLFVHEKCKNVIREIEGYVYKKDDVPLDSNNHMMDAIRYCLYAIAGKGASAGFTLPNEQVEKAAEYAAGARIIVSESHEKEITSPDTVPQFMVSFKTNRNGWQ